jgi:hypothetical protein
MGLSDEMPRVPESDEVRTDRWYREGASFRWIWPVFNVYRPADTRSRFLLNRYPYNVIGAAVVVFGRCWGVIWKGSYPRSRYKANR